MAINTVAAYQEALSLALEDRSKGYQDLVSNNNALLNTLRDKGLWMPYSGPNVRETLLYNVSGGGLFYSGHDFLNPAPAEVANDAVWTPKMAATPISLSNQEILGNAGSNQLKDILKAHIMAAETELSNLVNNSLHNDGTNFGGKEFSGLKLAIPTVVNTGVYGGIDRATQAAWRTKSYDVQTANTAIGTQVNSTTVRAWFNFAIFPGIRGKDGVDLLLCSQEHYGAFDLSTQAIQRINDETRLGSNGFSALKYYGGGRQVDVVLEGGVGSAMPANTTYGIDTSKLRMRYNPERNFDKLYKGSGISPINQDSVVNYIGFMGELTMVNPISMFKLYDSNPAA